MRDDESEPSKPGDTCKGAVGQSKRTPDNWEQPEDTMTTEACARTITQTEAILREWNARCERTFRELDKLLKTQTELILKALRTEGEPEHPVPFSPNKVLRQTCLPTRDAPVRPAGSEASATSRNQNSTEGTAKVARTTKPYLTYSAFTRLTRRLRGKTEAEYWKLICAFDKYLFNTVTPESHKFSALLQDCTSEDLRMVLESCEHFGPQKGLRKGAALLSQRFGGERGYA
ncbi:hypothetical protein Hamer_G011800 [Homarus americanus]|uniref:Uncharacterized protein n=1 Tax=Homarus americanus TaxID=6706 RepID=A0A8J5JX03_HOMAM|nr:hypothetical protein Hamer_G011800 [Homarus americanus]